MWHRLLAEYAAIARRDPVTAEGLRRGRRQVREKIAGVLENHAETFGVQFPMPAPDLAVVLLALGTGLALETDMEPAGIRDDLFAQVLNMMAANVTIDRAVSRS